MLVDFWVKKNNNKRPWHQSLGGKFLKAEACFLPWGYISDFLDNTLISQMNILRHRMGWHEAGQYASGRTRTRVRVSRTVQGYPPSSHPVPSPVHRADGGPSVTRAPRLLTVSTPARGLQRIRSLAANSSPDLATCATVWAHWIRVSSVMTGITVSTLQDCSEKRQYTWTVWYRPLAQSRGW